MLDLPSWIYQFPQSYCNENWSAELQTLEGHLSWVLSVAFSRDGRLLASGSDNETVRLWDTVMGALHETLSTEAIVTKLELSQDGSHLITDLSTLYIRSGHENHASQSSYRNLSISIEQINENDRDKLRPNAV
jgi:WD40 repeat protein